MSNAKYLADAYVEGLNEEEIEFLSLYNLKEVSKRTDISYYLLRKAVKGHRIPRSIYNSIVEFIVQTKEK